MAKWSDLPMELKQHVVELVDEDWSVRLGLAGSDAAPCKTLRSLRLVDRFFEGLVSPLLWHTIDLETRDLKSLKAFSSTVSPHLRRLVHRVLCAHFEDFYGQAEAADEAVLEILALLPRLEHLRVRNAEHWTVDFARETGLHSRIRSIELLSDVYGEMGALQSRQAAREQTILDYCPELQSVSVSGSALNFGGRSVLECLRGLSHLKSVELGSLHTLDGRDLRKPWSSRLTRLSLTARTAYNPTLVALLNQVGSSLHYLELSEPVISKSSFASPLPLQQLTHLVLGELSKSNLGLLTAFAKAPLLRVDLVFALLAQKSSAVDATIALLRQHRPRSRKFRSRASSPSGRMRTI